MKNACGIWVAMVTPMDEQQNIDEQGLRALVQRFNTSGVSGIFCLGTNGEAYTLSQEEKLRVIRIVSEEIDDSLVFCAGTGCNTTRETVELSCRAQELGADMVSVVTPSYGNVADEEMVLHYRTVAESLHIGVMAYNIPSRTGNRISPWVAGELSKMSNMVGIKDSSGEFQNILSYLQHTEDSFSVMCGNDALILSTLQAGGAGSVSGTANLFPGKISQLYRAFQEGDIQVAREIQKGLAPFRNCLRLGNANTVVKRTMALLGYPVGPVRNPYGGQYEKWDPVIMQVLETYYSDWN